MYVVLFIELLGLTPFQTIAFGLIDAVESRASDLQSQANSLGQTIDTAINSYEGIQTTKRELSGSLRFAQRAAVAAA
jgi:hypothetical protein